jgi:hypothetical protein
LRRVILFPLRVLFRMALVCMTATLIGLGGGLGDLGRRSRKVVKMERDNPVVCVAEESVQRE